MYTTANYLFKILYVYNLKQHYENGDDEDTD